MSFGSDREIARSRANVGTGDAEIVAALTRLTNESKSVVLAGDQQASLNDVSCGCSGS